jgi:hypothetical protein
MYLVNWDISSRISQGITLATTRFVALSQQIQSISHHWSPTLMATEKSSWWGKVNPPPPINQIKEETARVAEAEIAQASWLARKADKVVAKRHRSP